jgi:hypothetical protein
MQCSVHVHYSVSDLDANQLFQLERHRPLPTALTNQLPAARHADATRLQPGLRLRVPKHHGVQHCSTVKLELHSSTVLSGSCSKISLGAVCMHPSHSVDVSTPKVAMRKLVHTQVATCRTCRPYACYHALCTVLCCILFYSTVLAS